MELPDWFWITFTFAFGCCIGSFLNVVIYRLPREKSLVKPPSACPACGKHIRFYDNIPLVSYILLIGKCRNCRAKISPRYFIIELITGIVFVFAYYLFFRSHLRAGIPGFVSGGWLLYLVTIIMLSALIASSAIDLELWIIPLVICWVVTVAGIIVSTAAPLAIDHKIIRGYHLLPYASAKTAALGLGSAIGLLISFILLKTGLLKRSYDFPGENQDVALEKEKIQAENEIDERINHRFEAFRELLFLAPIIACAIGVYWLTKNVGQARDLWLDFTQKPMVAGFLGSVYGYFIGCAIVWATRIFGNFAFGKEAMGLGDVHLMGAAGAVIGPVPVTVAFFIAPFFGLGWAIVQLIFKKTRQIPYGPFLSMGIFVVILLHDRIWGYFSQMLGWQ